jgi:hypothetical protein
MESTLQQSIEVGMTITEASFLEYLNRKPPGTYKDIINEQNQLRYFNYELTPDTWNLLVNKQIYMKFERLFIEKQLIEKQRKEQSILLEIERLEQERQSLKKRREEMERSDMKENVERYAEQIQAHQQTVAEQSKQYPVRYRTDYSTR